jgi:hypothetical protein
MSDALLGFGFGELGANEGNGGRWASDQHNRPRKLRGNAREYIAGPFRDCNQITLPI